MGRPNGWVGGHPQQTNYYEGGFGGGGGAYVGGGGGGGGYAGGNGMNQFGGSGGGSYRSGIVSGWSEGINTEMDGSVHVRNRGLHSRIILWQRALFTSF